MLPGLLQPDLLDKEPLSVENIYPSENFHLCSSVCVCALSYSVMSDSVTPGTVACQAPLSMEFSRQEYWSE